MYNEPMLQQAGIKAPAKTWDELMEHSAKLKRDKISDTPYLPNWNNSGSGTMPQFLSDCHSEGANVFDAKNKVIADQEPGAARAMERWQKAYKDGLVNPEVLTRSEEHTSELQSRLHLVCRLLLEKKKKHNDKPSKTHTTT